MCRKPEISCDRESTVPARITNKKKKEKNKSRKVSRTEMGHDGDGSSASAQIDRNKTLFFFTGSTGCYKEK